MRNYVFLFIIGGFFIQCSPKGPVINIPFVVTGAVTNIMAKTATCSGDVVSAEGAAVTARGVCWDNRENPTIGSSTTLDGSGVGAFTSNLTGLTPNTTYYVRAYATNSVGTAYGEQKIFTSEQEKFAPSVTTGTIADILMTTASCSGNNVTTDGGSAVTSRGVCWSASQNPTTANPKTTDETGLGSYSSNITGLFPNTTYYVRAYAINAQGTAYGDQKSFTTEPGEVVGTYTDGRDDNVYKTVSIGHQVWMAENLAYLPSVVGPATGSRTEPYYYVYGYDSTDVATAKATANYKTYGVLYNWPAAMNGAASSDANPSAVKGVCPDGWHLPSDAEWAQLETYLASNGHKYDGSIVHESGIHARSLIAKSMADSSGWHTSSNEGAVGNTDYPEYRNKSGFSAFPGGYFTTNGDFYNLGEGCYWWSSREYDTKDAWNRYLPCHGCDVDRSSNYKALGFSVRCIRN
jgi:uncharacterized protein (TIGR02145 family)